MTDVIEHTGIPTEDGIAPEVPEDLYHADRGSLSQSGAKILITRGGPAKFREYIDGPRKISRDFDYGHMAHRKVLGKGAELAVLDPAEVALLKSGPNKGKPSDSPKQTAGWKDAERAARAAGLVPVALADERIAEKMAAKVREHPIAGPLLDGGQAEVSFYETDEETGVRMRGRVDCLNCADLGRGVEPVIVDYKTTLAGGADRDVFSRKAFDYGYYIQFPWYVRLYASAMDTNPPPFLFVVQEKVAPYLVNVIELDLDAYRLGVEKMREALRIYRDCTESGIWPGYDEIIHRGSLPPWAFTGRATINDLFTDDDE